MTDFDYSTHVARNAGYVTEDTQARLRAARLLIAGCGIGSSLAVCAARMGCERFLLVDGDVIERHNLNRQFYAQADVGRLKVEALRDELLRINPEADVEVVAEHLGEANTDAIVARADLVFDTVDFLDLPAILRLHAAARRHGLPVVTALSVGFGALVWWIPPGPGPGLREVLGGDLLERADGPSSYAEAFAAFVTRLAPHLDAEVLEQISRVLGSMQEGRPCPAAQVAPGSFAVGALAMTTVHDILAGQEPPASPRLIVHSFRSHRTRVVDLAPEPCPT